jgi:hypothetical protein
MTETTPDQRTDNEVQTLQRFALRWAILAAWSDELAGQRATEAAALRKKLEDVRLKLCAGCFSSCEVGCDLAEVEGGLVSKSADAFHDRVEFWIDLLGEAMSEKGRSERVLEYPAVEFQYLNCGFLPCKCGE